MTDKERLKEIQEKYDMWSNDFNLTPQDIEWLIEQTGRAIKNAEDLHVMDLQLASEQKLNKRYREQLELIRKDTFYEEHEFVSVRHLIRKRVDKALKGDKQ